MKKAIFVCGLLLGLFSICTNATVVYVDSSHVGGTQNGTTWAAAFSNFQSGINAANAGDSVWVATGSYSPISGSFIMKEGVKILGGFNNTNTNFNQRDVQINITKLKKGGNWLFINNGNALTSNSILDGFTITTSSNNLSYGAIFNKGSSPTFKNCIFTQLSGGAGAAIYNQQCSPTIIDCKFLNCTVNYLSSPDNDGGAIYNNQASPSIVNCIFTGNVAHSQGGAIYNTNQSNPTITNCSFNNNSAGSGGSIFNDASNCILINSVFQNNANSFSQSGGAINNNSTLQITGCSFLNNQHCAIFNTGDCNIDSSSFTGNSDVAAGAIYSQIGSLSITKSIFSGNSSYSSSQGTGTDGGAITAYGNINIDRCEFNSNIGRLGGAINCNNVQGTIKNSKFRGNVTIPNNDGYGSAIYAAGYSTNQTLTISNCLITGNVSANGIICNSGMLIKIVNCTIADNKTPSNTTGYSGAAIKNYYGLCKITNTIIWGNQSGGVATDGNSTNNYTITYSLVQGFTPQPNTYNLTGSPAFINSIGYSLAPYIGGDYHLQSGSICYNKGNNDSVISLVSVDLGGNLRILNDTVDIGAYEFNSTPLANNLISFKGTNQKNKTALLEWELSQYPIMDFELQRSTDGKIFQTIFNGSTKDVKSSIFSYLDRMPDEPCFYRLILKKEDQIIEYSKVIQLSLPSNDELLKIYPNPSKDIVYLNLLDEKLLNTNVLITDGSGKRIDQIRLENKSQQISLAGLAHGIYILWLENGSRVKIMKN